MLHRMTVACTVVLFFACAVLPAQDKKDKPEADKKKAAAVKKDQQLLQGTWDIAEFTTSGEALPAEEVKSRQVGFSGNQMVMSLAKEKGKREYEFTLDPTQKPKEMNLSPKSPVGKTPLTMSAIYELDGDNLKLCMTRLGGVGRPKEFESTGSTNTILIVLKRAKK